MVHPGSNLVEPWSGLLVCSLRHNRGPGSAILIQMCFVLRSCQHWSCPFFIEAPTQRWRRDPEWLNTQGRTGLEPKPGGRRLAPLTLIIFLSNLENFPLPHPPPSGKTPPLHGEASRTRSWIHQNTRHLNPLVSLQASSARDDTKFV